MSKIDDLKYLFPHNIYNCAEEALVSLASFDLQILLRYEARPIGVKASREPIQLGNVRSDQGPAGEKVS